jgi:hypothetical protein
MGDLGVPGSGLPAALPGRGRTRSGCDGCCPRCGGAGCVRCDGWHTRTKWPCCPAVARRTIALPLAALLDNVRSVFNVGSIFRSADGAGFQHLYLSGVTPSPASSEAHQDRPGRRTERALESRITTRVAAGAARCWPTGWALWALEEDSASAVHYGTCHLWAAPVVLVVGSEVTGVDPDVRALCHGDGGDSHAGAQTLAQRGHGLRRRRGAPGGENPRLFARSILPVGVSAKCGTAMIRRGASKRGKASRSAVSSASVSAGASPRSTTNVTT